MSLIMPVRCWATYLSFLCTLYLMFTPSRQCFYSFQHVWVVWHWGYKDKGLFPLKPSRRDVMVPMFGTKVWRFGTPRPPQFRIIARPPTSLPLISYFSTTSKLLPTLSLTLKGREGGREGRDRAPLRDNRVSPATTSRDRRTSFRRTDRPLPPVASRRSRVGTRGQ